MKKCRLFIQSSTQARLYQKGTDSQMDTSERKKPTLKGKRPSVKSGSGGGGVGVVLEGVKNLDRWRGQGGCPGKGNTRSTNMEGLP